MLRQNLHRWVCACIILEGCNTKLYSFDVGRHKDSTPIAVEVVDEYFPERHTYIEGDSKETLKEFNEQLDFAFVDGGHDKETCLSDIENFDRCLSAGGIMLVDDAHQSGVGNAIKSFDWEGYEELEVDNYEHKAKLYKKL